MIHESAEKQFNRLLKLRGASFEAQTLRKTVLDNFYINDKNGGDLSGTKKSLIAEQLKVSHWSRLYFTNFLLSFFFSRA